MFTRLLNLVFTVLFTLLYSTENNAQDSLRARAYDQSVKMAWTGKTLTRTNVNNDTTTYYFYHHITEVFTSVTEIPIRSKSKMGYHYRFDSTGLRRATVVKRRSFAKDLYTVYYFENDKLYYKESHGLPFGDEMYLLNKGIFFYNNARKRFEGPKLKQD